MKKLNFGWLEIPISDHCNIKCKNCSHHSPFLDKNFYDVVEFSKHAEDLTKVAHFSGVMLVGGEPLLHPHITDFIKISRKVDLANMYGLVTNGLLVHKITDELYKELDYIIVSVYPIIGDKFHDIDAILKAKSKKFNFKYHLKFFDYFYNIESEGLTHEEAEYTFKNCSRRKLSPMLHNGYFYKCMRPATTKEYLENRGDTNLPDFNSIDGINTNSKNLYHDIKRYMSSEQPLESCTYCLKGYEDSYKKNAYTSIKKALMFTFIHRFINSYPSLVKIHHVFNSKFSKNNLENKGRVKLEEHRILKKGEYQSKRINVLNVEP
ncbi:radical SAM protein [Acinetobacter baumannii]|uniref:radical SAM protein n=1 Tax=Acinetobacter nosocomialis TaxID=106654 RepID=UPI002342662F|nr:radical SAM protein [Acinetobacter baumannii]